MTDQTPAEINLRECQKQLDMDGCQVGVSRQALEEALDELASLRAENDRLNGLCQAHELAASVVTAKMNRDQDQLISERDEAEEALSQAYFIVIARSPEWSNNFHYSEALEEISDACAVLRETVKARGAENDRLRAALEEIANWDFSKKTQASLARTALAPQGGGDRQ